MALIKDDELIQILLEQSTNQEEKLEKLFYLACRHLRYDFSKSLTQSAATIAIRVGKIAELESALLQSRGLQSEMQTAMRYPNMLEDMKRFFYDIGLDNLVKKLESEL
jgi:hypothetical protein